jgi:hypothetical protein
VLLRLGRSVDRTRAIIELIENSAARPGTSDATLLAWLGGYERRTLYAERALGLLLIAVSMFVADCLSIALARFATGILAYFPVGLTVLGMMFLLAGAAFMLVETRLGTDQIHSEIARARGTLTKRPS